MPESELRTRLAPTPSGYLHWGNAFSFVITWLVARQNQGQLLLRIDDLDGDRKRPEYVDDIFRSLDWLGMDYDEGPAGPDDFEANFSQRTRLELYRDSLDRLRTQGDLFACACTRKQLQRTSGLHPASCRAQNLDLDMREVAWRMSTPDQTEIQWHDLELAAQRFPIFSSSMRDFVVRRKDQIPAYQIASVIDDVHFRVNCVVRGQDLLPSTAAQHLVANHLGHAAFSAMQFLHHPLVRDDEGRKLSKSAGASSLRAIRERDATPAQFYQRVARLLDLSEPATSLDDLMHQAEFQLPSDGESRLPQKRD